MPGRHPEKDPQGHTSHEDLNAPDRLKHLKELVLTYGWTRVTGPYILRQCAMGLCVAMFAIYLAYSTATIALYGYHTNAFWLGITGLFIAERVITVRRASWREVTVAALIFPELAYDALQHAVWLWCVAGWLFRTRTKW